MDSEGRAYPSYFMEKQKKNTYELNYQFNKSKIENHRVDSTQVTTNIYSAELIQTDIESSNIVYQ
jgi:hypothetical protein